MALRLISKRMVVVGLAGLGLGLACSSEESGGKPGYGGGSGTGGFASGGKSGSSSGGSSGSSASGGSSGTSDASDGSDEASDAPPDGPCPSAVLSDVRPQADFVFLVSGGFTMADDIQKLTSTINQSFESAFAASIVDWKVIVVGMKGTAQGEICIPPPLAQAACADNPPRFHHVSCDISNDSLRIATGSYLAAGIPFCTAGAGWGTMIRFGAYKALVEVSDDDADTAPPFGMDAITFDTWLGNTATPIGMFGSGNTRRYAFHSIVGLDPQDPTKVCTSSADAGGGSAYGPGLEYQKLSQMTGGEIRSICEPDWAPILGTIAQKTAERASCTLPVDVPAEAGALDPNRVNVKYTPGTGAPNDASTDVSADVESDAADDAPAETGAAGQSGAAGASGAAGGSGSDAGGATEDILQDNDPCDGGADGWQWSNDKKTILLCGPTCERVRKDLAGRIDIELGCETKVAP
jgi:hypothetical protein